MEEQSSQEYIKDDIEFEQQEKFVKKLLGGMALGGGAVTLVAISEAFFNFSDEIPTWVAVMTAVSGVAFTGSKIGYLHRINRLAKAE